MKKWEYRDTDIDKINKTFLNFKSQDGWELVGVIGDKVYFKRSLPNPILFMIKYRLRMWFDWSYRKRINEIRKDLGERAI